HRSDNSEITLAGNGACRRQAVSAQRDKAEAWLVSEHTAEMRRHADRAADIRADRERTETRGQCRSASARGAAGRAAEIPRIVRRPVDLVVALEIPQADRDVGLADDDGAGGLQSRDQKSIFGRLEIPELREAPCRRQAG